jgi:hypothetical protein
MNDMNKAVTTEVLLTSDDIRRWQEEIQRWQAAKIEADQHIGELRRKLDAAALIAGTGTLIASAEVVRAMKADDGAQESMGEAAKRLLAILATANRWPSHRVLQDELRRIDRFREMLDKNNGAYYYTMINRLVKRGEVKKIAGGRIRLVQKNETPPEGNPEGAS